MVYTEYQHFIDKGCKIPNDSDRWFRRNENGVNNKINSRFTQHEEPFDEDLP